MLATADRVVDGYTQKLRKPRFLHLSRDQLKMITAEIATNRTQLHL